MPSRPAAPPRPYHHGDLRAALIAAGRTLLEEGGPHALTFRAAARRVGVSHAAPGHHFGSLHGYMTACAADGFEQFADVLQQAAAPAVDPVDRLCAMGAAYVRFAQAHRALFRLMFDRDSFGERTPALETSGSRSYDMLTRAVAALKPGEETLDFRISAAWSLVHGYANLALEGQICHHGPGAADSEAARALRMLLRGMTLTVAASNSTDPAAPAPPHSTAG